MPHIHVCNGKTIILLWYFQEVIESQEKTITNLLKAVKEQHDQLDNQKSKIKNLEEKVSTVCLTSFLWEWKMNMGNSAFSRADNMI